MDSPVEYQNSSIAAFFDLDKTIIARSSALAFGRPFYHGGLIGRRDVLRSAYAQLVFRLGGADHEHMERMRAYVSELCRGWPVQQVRRIIEETLAELIDPYIYEEAAALIEGHRGYGHDVVIVSSSGAEIVRPIGELLGADRVIATRMAIEDGRYTGDIEFYAYAKTKAEAIVRLAEEQGYDLAAGYAYSDSITDLPMLEAVGHPHAVNPDRPLRRLAFARGWPILIFTQPVPLRQRLHQQLHRRLQKRPMLAATATVAAAAGLAWYANRRRVRCASQSAGSRSA
ncbi:MAG: HAD-IB family hydrolase [Streptosporangiales bacterium]|nr:HAD-IB family hydrolase [Streptosporangiales bacterium]